MIHSTRGEEQNIIKRGAYNALQAGEVRFWDEENWLGDVVVQGLEEGGVAAHGAAHQGLVGWKQKAGMSEHTLWRR